MAVARDTEAAIVADRLKAFVAAPAQFRSRLARGDERLPDGPWVLRFAQGRAPPDWSASETDGVRSAAQAFIRQVCLSDGADHYRVLCAGRDASVEALKENYHLLMGLLHPDRQDAALWPASCAQRVNVAYATLGDESARREYDTALGEPVAMPRMGRRPAPAPRADRGTRFARALLGISIVMAIFMAGVLMVHEDDWGERTLMDAAISSLRAQPHRGAERPRFVGGTLETARAAEPVQAEEGLALRFIKPLIARWQTPEPAAWVASESIPVARQGIPADAPARSPEPVSSVPAPIPAADQPVQSHPQRDLVRLAQAPAASPSGASAGAKPGERPDSEDIEKLVVAVVGYYEAGDVDRLMGLIDTRQLGYWRSAQLRQSYADFFSATRDRKLRVERLSWTSQPGAANATGEATVTAEYLDRSVPVERRLPIEMDVGMREGRAVITRLNVFPVSR